jgi:hypothetical protein
MEQDKKNAGPLPESNTEESVQEEMKVSSPKKEELPVIETAPTEENATEKKTDEKVEVIGVRFRPVGKSYSFDPDGKTYNMGDEVIVETSQGKEYGVVSTGIFFWLSVLYSIPLIGLLSCIIFCFAPKNENIRNFSKAHILRVVIAFLLSVLSVIAIGWLVTNMADEFEYWLMENGDVFAMEIEDFVYNNFGEFV